MTNDKRYQHIHKATETVHDWETIATSIYFDLVGSFFPHSWVAIFSQSSWIDFLKPRSSSPYGKHLFISREPSCNWQRGIWFPCQRNTFFLQRQRAISVHFTLKLFLKFTFGKLPRMHISGSSRKGDLHNKGQSITNITPEGLSFSTLPSRMPKRAFCCSTS
jgi:hypothetical protein